MQVSRQAQGDGEPPAYVFASPCCGAPTVLAAWIVEYAAARTRGRLLLQCGRYGADPLRAPGAVRGNGCGRPYLVALAARVPDTVERGARPHGAPRPVRTVRPGRTPGPASG